MDKEVILKSEQFMLQHMKDSAHDREHIYRVMNLAIDIARDEDKADINILLAACLLHDIGRVEQFKNPELCHAEVGAKMAYDFLIAEGVEESEAVRVKDCIASHRFRSKQAPDSIEAKILFDADTIEACGAIGIARSLQYEGKMGIPIYHTDGSGKLIEGNLDKEESFLQEYDFKLRKVYDRLYTKKGKEIAENRRETAVRFHDSLHHEILMSQRNLREIFEEYQGFITCP